MQKILPSLFTIFCLSMAYAQQPDIKNDFRLVVSDTIWSPAEPDQDGMLPLFKTKDELFEYFEEQNIVYDSYTYSVSDSLYVSKKPISNKDYAEFCTTTHKKVPAYNKKDATSPVTNLSDEDLADYCSYKEKLWGVWIRAATDGRFFITGQESRPFKNYA